MITPCCCEVWKTHRVFQGAVDKREAFSMAPAALRSRWVGA
jgi:hypothetical protein